MHIRWKEIIFSVGLGLVVPALLLSLGKGKSGEALPEPSETHQVQTDPADKPRVNVLMDDGQVGSLDLESYITGVVLREMPTDFEPEALKAQAVVARTYTLRRVEAGGKHVAAAVCTDPSCCQGYWDPEDYLIDGGSKESLEKVKQAVSGTEGMVLLYNGKLAEATYFSCSGGMTEDAQAVWGTDIPYLQATSSPGEESATHYTDTVSFSIEEFKQLLGIGVTDPPEKWIESVSYTKGGGVANMRICGRDFSGTELRKLLNLRSTAFAMTAVGNRVTVTTKGFGHRVGMSQYGADAMAVSGSNYAQILAHYYKGTQVSKYLYSD